MRDGYGGGLQRSPHKGLLTAEEDTSAGSVCFPRGETLEEQIPFSRSERLSTLLALLFITLPLPTSLPIPLFPHRGNTDSSLSITIHSLNCQILSLFSQTVSLFQAERSIRELF